MIGRSRAFLEALALIQKIARCDAPVLIEGETGTGKELAARAMHYRGSRQDAPFISVNCGALPDHLLENELFGHRRGAYTDARTDAPGLISLAHGGTLFLDEVDSLSTKAQVVLLRVLQDQRFRPLGAKEEVAVDVRIIAASNRELQSMAQGGQFREDLLFRINILYLALPPLRERAGDPALIANDFVGRLSERYGKAVPRISQSTLDWFDSYSWPGNVRELENLIHRQFLLCERSTLSFNAPPGLKVEMRHAVVPASPPRQEFEPERATQGVVPARSTESRGFTSTSYSKAKQVALREFSECYLHSLLSNTHGNVSKAARTAGKERRAFGRLLKRYGISPQSFR